MGKKGHSDTGLFREGTWTNIFNAKWDTDISDIVVNNREKLIKNAQLPPAISTTTCSFVQEKLLLEIVPAPAVSYQLYVDNIYTTGRLAEQRAHYLDVI